MHVKGCVPQIGVIVPAYNAAGTLHRTLRAIARLKTSTQELRFYCVLVDDASSDATPALVEAYLQQGVVDHYERNSQNIGVSAARNLGIDLCQHSDFITFCDADDEIISPDEAFITWFLSHLESDVIVFDHEITEGDVPRLISHQAHLTSHCELDAQTQASYLHHYLQRPNRYHVWTTCWSKLFRTALIHQHQIRFNPQMKVFEDVKFNFECLQYADQVRYYAAPMYLHYRPAAAQFKTSATMGGYCSVSESFAFDEALSVVPQVFDHIGQTVSPQEINHCLGAYAVITLIRSTLKIHSLRSFFFVRRQLLGVLTLPHFKQAFKDYNPREAGGNVLIPFLIRQGLMTPAIAVAYYQAFKRYVNQPPKV